MKTKDTALRNQGFHWEVLRVLAALGYPGEWVLKIGLQDKVLGDEKGEFELELGEKAD